MLMATGEGYTSGFRYTAFCTRRQNNPENCKIQPGEKQLKAAPELEKDTGETRSGLSVAKQWVNFETEEKQKPIRPPFLRCNEFNKSLLK